MTYSITIYFFFFNDTATTEIYTLSLHDALPIYVAEVADERVALGRHVDPPCGGTDLQPAGVVLQEDRQQPIVRVLDRKSTRLNSSHANISYAVFCLKKKKKNPHYQQ